MKTLTLILQIFCIVAIGIGIFIESRYEADFGFIFITSGALGFAVSEKLGNYRLKRDIRKSKFTKTKDHE